MKKTTFRKTFGLSALLSAMCLNSVLAENPNEFVIEGEESKAFADLDLSSTDNPLVKKGSGTLTMTDTMGGFATSDGNWIDIYAQEGTLILAAKENGLKCTNNIVVGTETSNAVLQIVGKAFGEHTNGTVTINGESELRITGDDTSMARSQPLTFNGSGKITVTNSNYFYNLRGWGSSIVVNGADSHALMDVKVRLIDGNHTINVADASSSLTLSNQIYEFNDSSYVLQGITKTGAGTLVLQCNNTFTKCGLVVEEGAIHLGGSNNNGSTVGTKSFEIKSGASGKALAANVFGAGDDSKIPTVTIAGTFTTFGETNLRELKLVGGTIVASADGDSLVFDSRTNAAAQKITSSGNSSIGTAIALNTDVEFSVTDNTLALSKLTGAGTLTKTGAGTLKISNPVYSSFSGTLAASEGTVSLGSGSVNNSSNSMNYVVGSPDTAAVLNLSYKALGDHYGSITIYDGSVINTGADITAADSNTLLFVGGGTIQAGSKDDYLLFRNRTSGATSTIAVSGANAEALIDVPVYWFVEKYGGGILYDVQDASSSLTISGCMYTYGSNSVGFRKTGAGTLILTHGDNANYAANSSNNNVHQFNGFVSVEAGTLALGADDGISTFASSVTLSSGAFLDMAGFDQSIGSVTGTGTITNSAAETAVLTLGARRNYYTKTKTPDSTDPIYLSSQFDGAIEKNVELWIDAGTETVTLGGANTNTGATKVLSGTLKLGKDNALSVNSASLSVADGADFDMAGFDQTLGAAELSGSIRNSASETSTLTLAPAVPSADSASPAAVVFSSTTGTGVNVVANGAFLANGATISDTLTINDVLRFDLGNETDSAYLTVGDLNFGAGASLDIVFDDVILANYDSATLVSTTGAGFDSVFSDLSTLFEASSAAYYFDLVAGSNSVILALDRSAVPEPSAWLLLLVGGAGLGLLRRIGATRGR